MARSDRRSAALTATLVAVPLAIGILLFSVLTYGGGEPEPTPTSAGPVPTSAVTMDAPTLPAEVATVCQAIVAELPETVVGQARRPVTAGAEQNAAYGEPPVTLSCGVDQPVLEPTAEVFRLSDVCWYSDTDPTETIWTTVDRAVPVRVVVPGGGEGSAQVAISFSAAIAAADPVRADAPTGCR